MSSLPLFGAQRLTEWLITDLNQSEEPVPDFTESRAKALLRGAGVVDDPTLHDFARLVGRWQHGRSHRPPQPTSRNRVSQQ